MLTPQIKSKLGSNGLNPKWWPRNEILHAFGLLFSSLRIFVDWRVVRIKKHDPCSLCSAQCAFKPEKVQSLEWKGLGTEKEDIGNYFATFHLLVLHFYHIYTNTDENGCTNENMHVLAKRPDICECYPPSPFKVCFNTIMFWLLIERLNWDNHNHCHNLQSGQSG